MFVNILDISRAGRHFRARSKTNKKNSFSPIDSKAGFVYNRTNLFRDGGTRFPDTA